MQAGFGPRPDLVAHVQQIGLEAFIDEQFSMAPQPYSPTGAGMIDIVNRSVYGPNPLRLRVAWALQSFLTRTGIVLQTSNFPFEEKMEKDASANYRDILTDLASDVSVAFFLNLAGNAAPSDPTIHPNQNFARELLQLFSLGTDQLNEDGSLQTDGAGRPIPAYDQGTILDLSRAFTGWNYAPPSNSGYILYGLDWSVPLRADESQHDHGQKVLFGTVVLPAGQSAIQDRAAAMDAIFNHPNLPPFVSRILIQRLVKSDPSKDYVKRIASVFKDNGKGIHGDMAAVIKAILLDQEARSGDAGQSSSDGFLQEPYIFQTSVMNIIGVKTTDAQSSYLPCTLKECIFYPSSVFGFFSPSYKIPGTSINSPEFQIYNNLTLINRSQLLWAIITNQQGGLVLGDGNWLDANFPTIPDLVDALNHLAYHGTMSQAEQARITAVAVQLQNSDPKLARQAAIFLALNNDNFMVVR
jgi:uncharacterized protein (DUF1800 family)